MRSIQLLALAAAVVLVAPSASAVTFDFANFADTNGEQGYNNSTPFTMTESGLTLTATAFRQIEGGLIDAHVYLDESLGGKPAGMGVCKDLDCAGENDDNLGETERLLLEFSSPVTLNSISFRDCDHLLAFNCGDDDDVPGGGAAARFRLAVDGVSLGQQLLDDTFAGGISGTTFEFRYVNEKYYLNLMDVTPENTIPEPATLSLLGTGLLAAGWRARGRRRTKK